MSALPEWLVVVILGVIEGITEFLPISSTGHMLLAGHWLPFRQSEVFLAVVQSGAVLAVLTVFAGRVKAMLTQWREPAQRDFILKLLAAFLLTAIGGLLLKKMHFKLEENARPVAWATLVGGVLILLIEASLRGKKLRDEVSWPVAVAVGAGQLLAVVFPGLSRSGSTILMALAMGVSRPKAAEFSFLLGIPTLLAAGALKVYGELKEPGPIPANWGLILLGTAVAGVTAFATVKWLLKYVQANTFNPFGWYRVVLGLLILLLARQ
jgi:undecaprenyl-diphosphatase